jgi:hypothetical protein
VRLKYQLLNVVLPFYWTEDSKKRGRLGKTDGRKLGKGTFRLKTDYISSLKQRRRKKLTSQSLSSSSLCCVFF